MSHFKIKMDSNFTVMLILFLSGSNLLAQNTLNTQFTDSTETPLLENISNYEQFYVPVTLTALNDVTAVNDDKQIVERPPLSVLRIGGEILAGSILGYGLITLLIGIGSSSSHGEGLAYALITLPAGPALGVYLIGNIGNQTGSFVGALAGSLMGFFVGGSIRNEFDNSDSITILPFLTGPVISTIFFNITRRYDSNYLNSGLTNLDLSNNNLELGFPNIYLTKLPQSNIRSFNIDIINVNF